MSMRRLCTIQHVLDYNKVKYMLLFFCEVWDAGPALQGLMKKCGQRRFLDGLGSYTMVLGSSRNHGIRSHSGKYPCTLLYRHTSASAVTGKIIFRYDFIL